MYTGTIAREEFGFALFDMIHLISGLSAVRQHLNTAIHKGEQQKLPALQSQYDALHAQIAAALPTLEPADCDAVLERYPWITTL